MLAFAAQLAAAQSLSTLNLDNNSIKTGASDLLKVAIVEIAKSEAGKRYFGDLDLSAIELSDRKNIEAAEGWIVKFNYGKDIAYVENPEKASRTLEKRVINSSDGIFFDLFITYQNGGAMVSRSKNFIVSENPRFDIAYKLLTKTNDEKLVAEINSVCENLRSHLSTLIEAK